MPGSAGKSVQRRLGPAWGLFWLLLAVWLAPPLAAAETPVLVIPAGVDRLNLSGHLAWFHDPTGRLDIEEVAAPGAAGRFTPLPGQLAVGYRKGAVWLRFRLQREAGAPATWWLESNRASVDEVTLYEPLPQGGWDRDDQGDQRPWAGRDVQYRLPVFRIDPPEGPGATYYMRIASDGALNSSLRLWQPPAFLQKASRTLLLIGGTAVAALVIVLLNLVHWLALRERLFLTYAAYVFTESAFLLYVEGIYHLVLAPAGVLDIDAIAVGAFCVFLGLIALLGRRLLNLSALMPRLDRAWRLTGLGVPLAGLTLLLAGHQALVKALMVPVMVLELVATALLGLWLLAHGRREALLFLAAFGALIVGVLYASLALLGFYENRFLTNTPVLIGSLVHMVLMQVNVNRTVYDAKRALDEAREQALEAGRRASQSLNREVERRTRELEQTKRGVERALEQERETSRALQNLLQTIAHEFRTPLAVIDAATELLRLKSGDSAETEPLLARIRRGTARMATLFDQVLTAGRIERGGFAADAEEMDLAELASWAEEEAEFVAGQRRLEIKLEPGLPSVRGDPELLRVLLDNLLSNALKYSPAETPVRMRLAREGEDWLLDIEDRGRGIPAEEQPRLFERFWRGRNVGNVPGVGLGLPVAQRIAQLHGGRIEVRSEENVGTRVRVRLPIAGPPARDEGGQAA